MKIFINYRRDDSAGYAGRLRDYLTRDFGEENVFMDIEMIEPGENFREEIRKAIGACDVVLVLIGKQWLIIEDAKGQRRLDDPADLLRAEISIALSNPTIRVIPVLVRDATMPDPQRLPDELQDLASRHAFELSDARFRYDANALIAAIKRIEKTAPPPPAKKAIIGTPQFGKITLAIVILGLLIGLASYFANASGALARLTPTPTITSTHTATSTQPPTSTTTASPTPSPVLTSEIRMMDQYYKYINNAGEKNELKPAWDLLTYRLQCSLYKDCKFVDYREWWWERKVRYKLYTCDPMVVQTEIIYYSRNAALNATPTVPVYVKYWLVNDHGQLKIDTGEILKEPDADCQLVMSSE